MTVADMNCTSYFANQATLGFFLQLMPKTTLKICLAKFRVILTLMFHLRQFSPSEILFLQKYHPPTQRYIAASAFDFTLSILINNY